MTHPAPPPSTLENPRAARPGGTWWAALAGVVAAATGFAVAEVVALVVSPAASPILAAGAAVVDQVPPWLKDFAVATFGTYDKAVLLATMAVVLALGAALAGWLELRRRPGGTLLLVAVGTVGAAVAVSRPEATLWWALPTAVGVAVAALVLRAATSRLVDWQDDVAAVARSRDEPPTESPRTAAERRVEIDRRRFLTYTGVAAVGAVLVGVGARALAAGARGVSAVRAAIRLPAAATPAAAVPAGAELGIAGLAPYVTPNDDFYRIDTALRAPQVDPDTWVLKVTGMVDEPFEITFAELLALPLTEHHVTLTCVSNYVGDDLVGNALWLGYPVRELLARAAPQAGADMVLSTSVDGWTASTPLDVLQDTGRECLLAVGMNGEPLPVDHGFPARLVVPGLYGYVSATKWVTELKVTTFAQDLAYWSTRGWTPRGPIKLASRIDTPSVGVTLDAGTVTVAGVAWHQHTGIAKVEVQVDDEEWVEAELAEVVSADTWRQWVHRWDATSGSHTLRVRATDADGQVQTSDTAPPAPDGATGWHEVDVRVR
ncbi:molybdopterin-dependent oxidoreductase [Sediminihabitans luteus]|uniref:molybdopterin-dependent oxidoreductase n=1 Tax=Sediminihabitans luteus TaxID=1138585 RepID=UPI001EF1CC4E|nr:molybdopterin-dependent oxidoreductase [Sediminihabitans luteus]